MTEGILVIGALGTGRSYLVKYLATNSYLPFITVFMNKFPYQKSHFDKNIEDNYAIGGSDDIDYNEIADSYDIDCDLVDTELELITKDLIYEELDLFDITFQLLVAKTIEKLQNCIETDTNRFSINCSIFSLFKRFCVFKQSHTEKVRNSLNCIRLNKSIEPSN
ncbi:ATPase [Orobanche hederae]